MRKQYFKFFSIILTFICIALSSILIYMKVFANQNESKDGSLNKKIISEIVYLDSSVIEAMNKLNNISVVRYKVYTKTINKPEEGGDNKSNERDKQKEKSSGVEQQDKEQMENSEQSDKESKENTSLKNADNNSNQISVSQAVPNNSLTETEDDSINWDEITYIYENLYSVWPTVKMDLKKLNIQDEYINKFNLDLNGIAQSINNKDKNSALVNFYNLYSQLPNYAMAVTNDSFLINTYMSKSAILNAYILANEENKWKEMSESISKAKSIINEMTNIIDDNDNRKRDLEKASTIIGDLENSIILNDKNIFYMQYKNAIQSLETL